MLPLQIIEVRYLDLIRRCHEQQVPFGVVSIKHGREVQVPGEVPVLHSVGCTAHIRKFEQVQPTLFRVLCQGGVRFDLLKVSAGALGVWQGDITYLP
jgi:Lon protease-like protein